MKKKYLGMLSAAASAAIFGIAPILAKIAYQHGSNSVVISFLRPLLSLPLIALIMAMKGVSFRMTHRQTIELIVTAACGSAATSLLLYGAYTYIPVGMATALHFTYPAFVAVAGYIFFKTRLPLLKLVAVALSVAGAALFFTGGNTSALGVTLALLSGVTYTFFILMVERSSLASLNVFQRTFYVCLVGSAVAALFGLATGKLTIGAMDGTAWLVTVIVSVSVSVGALVLFQLGITLAGGSTAAILSTLEPIVGVVLGVLILKEELSYMKLAACVLIVAAVLLVGLAESERHNKSKEKLDA